MTKDDRFPDERRSNPKSDTSHVRFDWSRSGRPSVAVVEAVATTTGREPTELPPLYDSIDVDALDALVTTGVTGTADRVSVSFAYDGVEIEVDGGGAIVVRPDAP